jgi:hypothetical protein
LVLALAGTARGADEASGPPERVRITYSLGPDCPTPESFEREVGARVSGAWKAADNELARTMTIADSPEGGRHVMRLDYPDSTGRTLSRSVSAATCEEALSLMVVVTAVAIDAQMREPQAAHESPGPPSTLALTASTPAEGPAPVAPAPPSSAPAPSAFVHEAGIRFEATGGFGPGVALGLGAEWGMVGRKGFALRAGADFRGTGVVDAADGRARFRALTGRADGCFTLLRPARWFGLPLCAGLEAGVLWADGVISPPAVTFSKTSFIPWVAAAITPRLRLSGDEAFVELAGELRAPLVRHTFAFENPERAAFSIPAFAFGAALSAGVRFQ